MATRDIDENPEFMGTASTLEDLIKHATNIKNQYGNLPIGTTNWERDCVDEGLDLHLTEDKKYVELR